VKKFFVGLFLATCLALGYVQQRVSLITLGYGVEAMTSLRDDLLDQHRVLHYNVLALQSPVILDERLAHRDIQLAPPQEVEFVTPRLVSPPPSSSWNGVSKPRFSWWQQALERGSRWMENGRQAVAAPAREERS